RVDGAYAEAGVHQLRLPAAHPDGRCGIALQAGHHGHVLQRVLLRYRVDLVGDNGLEIGVEDLLLLIRQLLETGESAVKILLAERVAKLMEALLEGMPAGVLAQDQAAFSDANILRA